MSNYTEDDLVRWAALDGQYVDEKIRARAEEVVAEIKAAVWDEAYWQGVEDERTAEAVQMNVGPNRNNPYRNVKDN